MCSGSSQERETLRYCIEILSEREREDPGRAWLWRLKKKVALYQIGLPETPQECDPRPLTDADRSEIRRNHPLLQNTKIRARKKPDKGDTAWFKRMRERVTKCFRR